MSQLGPRREHSWLRGIGRAWEGTAVEGVHLRVWAL